MQSKFLFTAFISGILLSLAWVTGLGFFIFFAFVPLFIIEHKIVSKENVATSNAFFLYSFIVFFIWNLLSTWWIGKATLWGLFFAVLLNTLLMSGIWSIFHVIHKKKVDSFAYIFLVALWIVYEYFQLNWEMAWPWLLLGNGLANNIQLIQWYEFTGVLGGSVWVLAINILIARFLCGLLLKNNLYTNILLGISVLFVFTIPFFVSQSLFTKYNESNDPVNIAILQPNIDPYSEKFDEKNFQYQYDLLFNLTNSITNLNTDLIIGPETVLHNVWIDSVNSNLSIAKAKMIINERFKDASFILGAITYVSYSSQKKPTVTARKFPNSNNYFDIFNSALFINDSGSVEFYHKSKLVPGVEKAPFAKYLNFWEPFMINMGGANGSLANSNEIVVFQKDSIIVGVPICYESVFGEYVSRFIKKGANVLVVITNDGWWNNSQGYIQHFSFSKALAISHRRSIARAGNTGISCIINQKGEIQKQTYWWKYTSLTGTLNKNNSITFYSTYGDYIGIILCGVLAVMISILVYPMLLIHIQKFFSRIF